MTTTRAIAYARVSTSEQVESGAGLNDQRQKLAAEITHRGWELVELMEDQGESGKDLDRPQIRRALDMIAAGDADALVVTKLDRLTRSVLDFAELAEWADRLGVRLVILDLGIDTGTTTGRLVAGIMAQVAQWERSMIALRTRDAAAGRRDKGEIMGRASVRSSKKTHPGLADRIKALRVAGSTWQVIADTLNAEHVPTVRGGSEWRVSSVQSSAGYVRPPASAKRVSLPEGKRRRRAA
jgi:DNA invertase Pin-like site-specific DNA recombinase